MTSNWFLVIFFFFISFIYKHNYFTLLHYFFFYVQMLTRLNRCKLDRSVPFKFRETVFYLFFFRMIDRSRKKNTLPGVNGSSRYGARWLSLKGWTPDGDILSRTLGKILIKLKSVLLVTWRNARLPLRQYFILIRWNLRLIHYWLDHEVIIYLLRVVFHKIYKRTQILLL